VVVGLKSVAGFAREGRAWPLGSLSLLRDDSGLGRLRRLVQLLLLLKMVPRVQSKGRSCVGGGPRHLRSEARRHEIVLTCLVRVLL